MRKNTKYQVTYLSNNDASDFIRSARRVSIRDTKYLLGDCRSWHSYVHVQALVETSKRTVDAPDGVKLSMSGDAVRRRSNKEAGIQSAKRQEAWHVAYLSLAAMEAVESRMLKSTRMYADPCLRTVRYMDGDVGH